MELDEPPRERKTQPGALGRSGRRSAGLLELLEDPLLVRRRDPDTRVGDRDLDDPVVTARDDMNPPTRGLELHRFRQQVEHYLANLALVVSDEADIGLDRQVERDVVPGR